MTANEQRSLLARCKKLERSIKNAMANFPPGEHWHLVELVYQQNDEILELKTQLRIAKRRLRFAQKQLRGKTSHR